MTLRDTVVANHLGDALDDLSSIGRYWPGAFTRPAALVLCDLLIEQGRAVRLHELPPEWEQVVSIDTPARELERIARSRTYLRAAGVDEGRLPR